MKPKWMMVLPLLALLSACEVGTSDTPPPPAEGREETRGIRNTSAIGYSGDAIADKVDGALNANDQRMQQLQESEARSMGDQ